MVPDHGHYISSIVTVGFTLLWRSDKFEGIETAPLIILNTNPLHNIYLHNTVLYTLSHPNLAKCVGIRCVTGREVVSVCFEHGSIV